jgi:hypothetical protein|tara:strand:+ start:2568 stop:2942 length:375 start_codon:yes stop_codon:yes gene_type:complete
MSFFSKRVVEFIGKGTHKDIRVNGNPYSFKEDPLFGDRKVSTVENDDDYKWFLNNSQRRDADFAIAEDLEAVAMTSMLIDAIKKNPEEFAIVLAPVVAEIIDAKASVAKKSNRRAPLEPKQKDE